MARTANKKTVNNNAGLLNVIDGVNKKDVVEIADFGSFFIVLLKDGAIFHTHLGYEIRCKRWVTDFNGDAKSASLYSWLENLILMKKEAVGKQDEIYPETGVTFSDILDSMKTITEGNLLHPVTAFTDMESAAKFAQERLDWLIQKSRDLAEAMNKEVKEETEEDMKANFEHAQRYIVGEQIKEELKEGGNGKS